MSYKTPPPLHYGLNIIHTKIDGVRVENTTLNVYKGKTATIHLPRDECMTLLRKVFSSTSTIDDVARLHVRPNKESVLRVPIIGPQVIVIESHLSWTDEVAGDTKSDTLSDRSILVDVTRTHPDLIPPVSDLPPPEDMRDVDTAPHTVAGGVPVGVTVEASPVDGDGKGEESKKESRKSKAEKRAEAKRKADELEAHLRPPEPAVAKKDKEKKKPKKAATGERTLDRKVVVRDLVVGSGNPVRGGRMVSILYEGTLSDGTVFDANHNRRSPLRFRQGLGQVIKGLEIGIEGMRVGGERTVVCPSDTAYGKQRLDGIPPNSTLTFHVQLVEVRTSK